MAGIQISGLISGSFDWKSVVDQLIQIDSAPITRLQTEESNNIDRLASFSSLQTKLTDLNTSAKALGADGLFNGRTAKSSSGSGWSMSAADDSVTGNYTITVSQLATTARRNGASAISQGISATDNVSAVTLASMPTSTAISAGVFTVNGKQVTIALTDTLEDAFSKISDATGGVVTASYESDTDKVTFASNNATEVVFGAGNDTSNFLSALRLSNNGGTSVTSSSTLGSAALTVPLASGRLRGAFGGVDVSGNGAFAINGVNIDYNVNTDSLSNVLARITSSAAGVTASYDLASDRVILTNKATGDTGIGANDTTGTLLSALGLTSGSTLQHGQNALFTVDGGGTIASASNTLSASSHGIDGLTVTVNSATTQTINVAPDTASMNTAIQDFISKFNAVQSYVESQTKITKTPDGKVSAALLADNHEVQTWASELRSLAFKQVSGLTGTIQRLEHLGLDFSAIDSTLRVKDQAKLDTALSSKGADVEEFFGGSASGFSALFENYLTPKLSTSTGALATQMATLNKQNTGIEVQIATLNARLANQRELLTTSFLAMQNAQSLAQQQQQQLTNMFSQKTTTN
jgi:flagellar hook-associated protein 2